MFKVDALLRNRIAASTTGANAITENWIVYPAKPNC